MVVEGDMDDFPAGPGRALGAVPGDPMPRPLKAPGLLDVEIEHKAGPPKPFVGSSYADATGVSGFLDSQTASEHSAHKKGSILRR